jgi:hypothetical protein
LGVGVEIGLVGLVGLAIGVGVGFEIGGVGVGGTTIGGGLVIGGDIGGEGGGDVGYPDNSARPSSDSTEIDVVLFARRSRADLWLNI